MKSTMLIEKIETEGKIAIWQLSFKDRNFTCIDSFYIGKPVPFKSIVHYNLYDENGKRKELNGSNFVEFMKFKELFIHRSMFDELFLFSINS